MRKVCRYLPAGDLARLLTQVLLGFGLFHFLFFFVFPSLPPQLEQRRTGIPWFTFRHTEWAIRTTRAEGRMGLTRRFFFALGTIGRPGQQACLFRSGRSPYTVPQRVLTLPFLVCRAIHSGGPDTQSQLGVCLLTDYNEREEFCGDGSQIKEALLFCGRLFFSLLGVYDRSTQNCMMAFALTVVAYIP